MEYYAHISDDGLRRQTVTEHCRATAHYAAECLSGMDLSKAAYLAGLLHDAENFRCRFRHILKALRGKKRFGAPAVVSGNSGRSAGYGGISDRAA